MPRLIVKKNILNLITEAQLKIVFEQKFQRQQEQKVVFYWLQASIRFNQCKRTF
ncbi:unnamed protein product [Paramecium octaurelia]|uniref:Uncharacterized protein n=1 Tax=Paramecium octaurelia TaxID=43137 RepID=A0A8S1TJD4_PAROT|nr:unnamed protein product [Paramecium octaurelia]